MKQKQPAKKRAVLMCDSKIQISALTRFIIARARRIKTPKIEDRSFKIFPTPFPISSASETIAKVVAPIIADAKKTEKESSVAKVTPIKSASILVATPCRIIAPYERVELPCFSGVFFSTIISTRTFTASKKNSVW